ncbi:MAG: hypothetical protein J6Y59_05380 [Bacteroidaceae bacterium]|nr:hypothetical protein [Bacteroidaceae bacterium]
MKKHNIISYTYYYVLVVLMLFFAIYTATKFPYTYITMEGDDFWALTRGYWQMKLAMLPAFSNWLSDFLKQFYFSPYLAAAVQTSVLGLTGLLAYLVLRLTFKEKRLLHWLGLLPPILLGYYCTFDLSFQLQWLFFFAFLLIYRLIPNLKAQLFWSILSVAIGFFLMRTPILFLLLLSYALMTFKSHNWKKSLYLILPLSVLIPMPLVYSQQVAFIPFEERYMAWGGRFEPLTSSYNQQGEYVKKLVCLSSEGKWEELIYKARAKNEARRGNGVALRYALLAESALGTLPENLFDYPISDENLFLFPHQDSSIAHQFNWLFYLNLGVYDEVFHQAEEYGLRQPNGVCFSSLRQMVDSSIEEGDWEIAEKYLQILSKSSRHKGFVRDSRARIQNSKKQKSKDIPLRADNFVGGYSLPVEMLRLTRYYGDASRQKKMTDYAICSYILRGDRNSFRIAVQAFDIYKDKPLPRAYQLFMDM